MGNNNEGPPGSAIRSSGLAGPFAGFAICFAVVVAHSDAEAGTCAPPTPECHLANGKKLLASDPKRAAEELWASYQLDERTDTLALFAQALQADKRYARALVTWQRIILFREGEIESAKETMRSSRRKREAARAALARAQAQSEAAAAEIIELWGNVARVKIDLRGQSLQIWHDGIAVDVDKDVLVNAGRDELVFTRKVGNIDRVIGTVVVELGPGQVKTIAAPSEQAERIAGRAKPAPERANPAAKPAKSAKPNLKLAAEPKRTRMPAPDVAATRWVDEPRSPALKRAGMIAVAGGVAGLAIAGTLGYLANRDLDDARGLGCDDSGECPFGPATDLAERGNDRARLAQWSAIGGGALLVGGAAMYLVGRTTTKRAADITVSVTHSSIGIAWSLQ